MSFLNVMMPQPRQNVLKKYLLYSCRYFNISAYENDLNYADTDAAFYR